MEEAAPVAGCADTDPAVFAAAGLFNTPDGAASEESSEVAEVAATAGRFKTRVAAALTEELANAYLAHHTHAT